jgi:outer membrane protein TolC
MRITCILIVTRDPEEIRMNPEIFQKVPGRSRATAHFSYVARWLLKEIPMSGCYPFALWLAVVLGVFAGPLARAAESPGSMAMPMPAMTLPDALAYARAHQPALRAAAARMRAAYADSAVPRAQWQPTVTAGAQLLAATANNTTNSYVGLTGVDIPRIGGTRVTQSGTFTPDASTFAALSATQEVFDFGRIAAQGAVLDALAEAERARGHEEQLLIDLAVEEAYFAVHTAREVVKASDDAFERARVHRDDAKAAVRSGLRAPIELTRAEADLTRFDVGTIRARGNLVAAQSTFAAAVGVPELQLDATGVPPNPAELPALPEALARAAARDPGLRAAVQALEAQRSTTRAIGAELRPNLALTATLSGREGGATPSTGDSPRFDGWLPSVPNWDLGVVLRIPLYDGTIQARRAASRVREDMRAAEVDVVKQRQQAEIQQAFVRVNVAGSALVGLQRAVEAARANYAQADARFKAGLGTSVELADAEAVRADAEIQLALGRFDVARARAMFGRLIAEGL